MNKLLNNTDTRLLALLRENARLSTSELARELGLSRSTVHGRIRRLEQTGVIRGYTLDYGEEYESRLISAHVQINVSPKLRVRTNRELHARPEIKALHAISGDYDLIAIIQAESTESLSRLLDEIGNLEGVDRTNSSVILETKFSR